MSSREANDDVKGCRAYYWSKDMTVKPKFDLPNESDFVTMIDVDYYVDMPDHLARNAHPHLLYTVQPETAGRMKDDYSYSFMPNGELVWKVRGGATYQHLIWNYATDWCTATTFFWGIPTKTVTYDVVSRMTSSDKQLVMLTPMKVTYGLSAILAYWMGKPLQRLSPVSKGFAKVKVTSKTGKTVSVARVGAEFSCTIPASSFESLLSTRNVSPKNILNIYQVKSAISSHPDKDLVAPILTDFFNHGVDFDVDELSVVEVPKLTLMAYSAPDPSDKPLMVPFANAFVPPAFVPVNNKSSSEQSILGRVLIPQQQAAAILKDFKMTPTKQRTVAEFVSRLLTSPHTGVPYDYDSVAERQTKPGQKRDLEAAGFLANVSKILKTFMKREGYGKPTDPRNISTFNPKDKLDYAHFIYPLMDELKKMSCYAFGRSPKDIADKVASISALSNKVCCPDISRMDGFVNALSRALELAVGRRFFAPEYKEKFSECHARTYGNVGITTHGERYEQGESRGSGEMGTSLWNTIINLFILFNAKYTECRDYDASWTWLMEKVLAGGDDSIAGDIEDRFLILSARDCGFILKCPTYMRGDSGVNFLARIYGPDVWNGDPNSVCSLRRQLEKFHLTVHATITPQQKLFEKSVSFHLTDANTPVIGPLVNKVLSLTPGYQTTGTVTRFGDDWSADLQYPNAKADWMNEVAKEELPLLQLESLVQWIDEVKTLDELLNAPCFFEEGREFTFDEWDPEPGIIVKRTLDLLVIPPAPPPVKRQRAVVEDKPKKPAPAGEPAKADSPVAADKKKKFVKKPPSPSAGVKPEVKNSEGR
jgi:hypothetical protein